jgi:hypothetical protein
VGVSEEKLRRLFPNLFRELKEARMKVAVTSIRSDVEIGEKATSSTNFAGYTPDVIDFLKRCDTEEQAEDIINYLEKRGEISSQYASRLRKQLREKGVRSFGAKKEPDYYLKKAGYG